MKVMGMGRGNGCLLGGGEGVGVGLYSLSSSVGWKAEDFTASEVSLAFPFKLGSASILRLRREFSCLNASISSALRFFRSVSSCCIFAWPSRMGCQEVQRDQHQHACSLQLCCGWKPSSEKNGY